MATLRLRWDPPELITERRRSADALITYPGEPADWTAVDVETIRELVHHWLIAGPRWSKINETWITQRLRTANGEGDPFLRIGVLIGMEKAWVDIYGLQAEVVNQLPHDRSEDQAQRT